MDVGEINSKQSEHRRAERSHYTDRGGHGSSKGDLLTILSDYHLVAWETGSVFTILIVRLDDATDYASQWGHLATCALVRRVEDLVRASVRRSDYVFPWKEHGFLIAVRNAPAEIANLVAERLRINIERFQRPFWRLTASIGVATWHPEVEDAFQLIQMAEEALEEATSAGGNRVRAWAYRQAKAA